MYIYNNFLVLNDSLPFDCYMTSLWQDIHKENWKVNQMDNSSVGIYT